MTALPRNEPDLNLRCWLCNRDVSDGDYVNVSRPDGTVGRCCSVCWEKGDEYGIEVPVDYTEDDEFQNREGQPEFNGAFNAW